MKRRELIKLGSAIFTGASVGALTGYGINSAINKNDDIIKVSNEKNILKIEPKQLAPYEFSFPMLFDKRLIDKLAKLNDTLTKGKITTLFSALPYPLSYSIHPFFNSQMRGTNNNIKTVDDYLEYVRYATDKGFKCVYVLNTTAPVDPRMHEFLAIVISLFKKLNQGGIKAVKLANPNLIHIMSYEIPELEIHLSTTNEYHDIQVYKNLLKVYPNIKLINVTADDNHNFVFLMSLKKLLPDVKIDILVNETNCIKNCPAIFYHAATGKFYPCEKIIKNNLNVHLARNRLVHPWWLEYYSAIGINNFKFTSIVSRANITNINYIKYYLDCVENGIDKYSSNDFINKIYYGAAMSKHLRFKNMPLAKLIESFPDINYLIANGERCASECEVNCRYCFDCAEKIKKIMINT